jgi:copper oxidase (laccase) domain-containing protein
LRKGGIAVSVTETFATLAPVPGLVHGFIGRIPGVDVQTTDKRAALSRLRPNWEHELAKLGVSWEVLWTAEQVHGDGLAVVPSGPSSGGMAGGRELEGVDGLVTGQRGVYLGVLVADCCAVYLVDVEKGACGLVHSGKRGTALGIVPRAIALMGAEFGSRVESLQVVLSPCIRPPRYEVDFAAEVRRQCLEAGVPPARVEDTGRCTGDGIRRYYSYRCERGKTGRMLAVLGFAPR